jgi:hypothetical protein
MRNLGGIWSGLAFLAWHALLGRLALVQLSQERNEFRWNLHQNGSFSVDFMYRTLSHTDVPVDNNKRKLKVPLKIIKNWYLHDV